MNSIRNSAKINLLFKDRFEAIIKQEFPRIHKKVLDFYYDALAIQQLCPVKGYKTLKDVPCIEMPSSYIKKLFGSYVTSCKITRILVNNGFIKKDNSWIPSYMKYNVVRSNHWHLTAADYDKNDTLITLKLASRPIISEAIQTLKQMNKDIGLEGNKVIEAYDVGSLSTIDLLKAGFFAESFLANLKAGQASFTKDNREYSAVAMCPKKIRSILFGLEEAYDIPAASLPTTLLNHQVETGDESNKQIIKDTLSHKIDAYEEVYKNTDTWKTYYKNWKETTRKRIKDSFSVVVHCTEKQLWEFTKLSYLKKDSTKEERYIHNNHWTNFEVVESIKRTFPQFAKILAEISTKQDAGQKMFLYHTKGEKYFMDKVFQKIESKGVDVSYAKLNVVRVHDAIWCKPEYKEVVNEAVKEIIESL